MSDKRAYRVLKFGGSSVASATAMSGVLDIVEKEAALGRVILVSSAISGCTDALLGGDAAALESVQQRHAAIVSRLFTGSLRTHVQERVDGLFTELAAAPSDEKVTFGELLSTTILEENCVQKDMTSCGWIRVSLWLPVTSLKHSGALVPPSPAQTHRYLWHRDSSAGTLPAR